LLDLWDLKVQKDWKLYQDNLVKKRNGEWNIANDVDAEGFMVCYCALRKSEDPPKINEAFNKICDEEVDE
jgi:hypothetical protein